MQTPCEEQILVPDGALSQLDGHPGDEFSRRDQQILLSRRHLAGVTSVNCRSTAIARQTVLRRCNNTAGLISTPR